MLFKASSMKNRLVSTIMKEQNQEKSFGLTTDYTDTTGILNAE
jgi:hypothetical protein